MIHTEMQLETADGRCEAHAYNPEGPGSRPAVLMYMDGIGMRPAMKEIAERIAGEGYYVLLPDLFYRVGYKAANPKTLFSDPVSRADFMTRVAPSASAANIMRDTEAYFAHFESQPRVKSGPIAITGYCIGGRLSMYAAGHFGDRVAAAASYHGGGLATDAPDSPHRLAPRITGRVYVAGAIEDGSFDDAQKERLRRALTDADVDFSLETYDARHGWVPADTPAHDPVAAQRHYQTLFNLLEETVR